MEPSEELEIKWFKTVAIGGDEIETTVDAAINLVKKYSPEINLV